MSESSGNELTVPERHLNVNFWKTDGFGEFSPKKAENSDCNWDLDKEKALVFGSRDKNLEKNSRETVQRRVFAYIQLKRE